MSKPARRARRKLPARLTGPARLAGGQGTSVAPPEDEGLAEPGYVVAALRNLLAAKNTTSNAKASAARTLAEIAGVIGRHQQAPTDRTAEARVSLLTRTELERELARLRTICAGDKA
jgi:hypothetical protein